MDCYRNKNVLLVFRSFSTEHGEFGWARMRNTFVFRIRLVFFLILILVFFVFSSCEVTFSGNKEWVRVRVREKKNETLDRFLCLFGSAISIYIAVTLFTLNFTLPSGFIS